MKKSYLMIAAAATLLTACMGNDTFKEIVNDNETVMIGFETYHEKSTRATGEISQGTDLTSAHGGFGVWGFKYAPAHVPALANNAVSVANTAQNDYCTTIFNNVKVWYENDQEPTQGYKYEIPKYWDKNSHYIFFAYAPQDDANASFDNTTGRITISAIPELQDISTSSGSDENLVYGTVTNDVVAVDATNVTDYLMASYVPEQYLTAANTTSSTATGTNQNYNGKTYDDKEQTVGFTFGHILSKLQVSLQAKEQYSGIKSIAVTKLYINNMPCSDQTTTSFTQTSPAAPAGVYATDGYESTGTLKIIDGANSGATSEDPLYILKNGAYANNTITSPSKQNQNFVYYVVPNDPNGNTNEANKKYKVDVDYTITYVDQYTDGNETKYVTENVSVSGIELSWEEGNNTVGLQNLLQNNYYILTIKIGLNQIYFTVDDITGWDPKTAGATTPAQKEIVIQ